MPAVIGIATVTTLIWLIAGQTIGFALARGIAVLVISCPCALGLATPVAIMVGNGMGAKHGIMFKTAVSLEETGKTEIVALDKTGTITKGEPKVTDLVAEDNVSEEELLFTAYVLERKSEHPLARAITSAVESLGTEGLDDLAEVEDFQIAAGNGLSGMLNGQKLVGGSYRYISGLVEISEEMKEQAQELAEDGRRLCSSQEKTN